MTSEQATRIKYTLQSPGWQDIAAILDGLIKDSEEEFSAMLARSPEKINLRTAQKYAVRIQAFKDFRESVEDTQKIANNPQPAYRAGIGRAGAELSS